jgi:DNA-binding transcriptional LysR family regulator
MRRKEYAVVITGMRRAGQPAPLRLTRRGRVVVLTFFILLASLASAVLWTTASRAEDPPAGPAPTVVVQPDDTLWAIAAVAGKTDLLGILPRRLAEEFADGFNLTIHTPPAKIAEQHLYMMWHERNQDDIGHRWLRQRVTAAAEAVFGEQSAAL